MVGLRLVVGQPATVDVGRWDVGGLAGVHYGRWFAYPAGSGAIAVRRGVFADRMTIDRQGSADVWRLTGVGLFAAAGGVLVAASKD